MESRWLLPSHPEKLENLRLRTRIASSRRFFRWVIGMDGGLAGSGTVRIVVWQCLAPFGLGTVRIRLQVSGWHDLETRGTSVEGRSSEVDMCVVHTLFTNVPETCHPFCKLDVPPNERREDAQLLEGIRSFPSGQILDRGVLALK